jgi:hypothetical protein
MKPHRGTLILILGILSLVVCGFVGPVAWIMGNNDLKEIDAGVMDPAGRGNVNAGRICGLIATVLMAIGLVVSVVVLIFFLAAAPGMHR